MVRVPENPTPVSLLPPAPARSRMRQVATHYTLSMCPLCRNIDTVREATHQERIRFWQASRKPIMLHALVADVITAFRHLLLATRRIVLVVAVAVVALGQAGVPVSANDPDGIPGRFIPAPLLPPILGGLLVGLLVAFVFRAMIRLRRRYAGHVYACPQCATVYTER